MKRDVELIRKILQLTEKQEDPESWVDSAKVCYEDGPLHGYLPDQVGYHIYLLHDAGLITATNVSSMAKPMNWVGQYIRWEGHEFLEASRDESRWEKAKQVTTTAAGGLSFEVLKNVLSRLAMDALPI